MFPGPPPEMVGFDKGGCSPWSGWGREGGMRDNSGGGVGL